MASEMKSDIEILFQLSKQEHNSKQKNIYDTVLNYLEGKDKKDISALSHTPIRTVSYHIQTYKNKGIEGLKLKTSSGRKRKLNESQENELKEIIITKTPEECGIDIFTNWTAKLVCRLVQQKYKVIYSTTGMLALMHRLNLSFTRPTYTLKKADPIKQEEFRDKFEELKKNK